MNVEDARMPPQHSAEARHAIRLGDDVVAKVIQKHVRLALQMGDETGDVSDLSSRRSRRRRGCRRRHPARMQCPRECQTDTRDERSRWIRC